MVNLKIVSKCYLDFKMSMNHLYKCDGFERNSSKLYSIVLILF